MFYLLIFHVYHWLCFLFRDGVSESQFNQVLNIELDQIIKVLLPTHFPNCLNWSGKLNCWTVWTSKLYDLFSLFFILFLQAFRHLDKEEELPKFTVLVAQKNHHTKLFQAGSTENVPPGLHLSLNCDVPNPIKVFHWPHLMVDRCSHFSFVKMIWIYFFFVCYFSTGTVVDTKVVHPRNYDFYMCAHAGIIVSIAFMTKIPCKPFI